MTSGGFAEMRAMDAPDVQRARHACLQMGRSLGMTERLLAEAALLVVELASNLVKHAQGGIVRICFEIRATPPYLYVETQDKGPKFQDILTALEDGCTAAGPILPEAFMRRGGLGTGLGAVTRFSHSLRIIQEPDRKTIRAERLIGLPVAAYGGKPCAIQITQ